MPIAMRVLQVLIAVVTACGASSARAPARKVSVPGGGAGVGFDDLRFSARLGVIAPAARTGAIAIVEPRTLAVTAINGFSTEAHFDGGHDFGVTSADDTGRWLLATDRTTERVQIIDPAKGIVAGAKLAHGPDYVRWVASRHEVWVTEPDAEAIEIFTLDEQAPALTKAAEISVKGGPESLVIDDAGGRAYAHLWDGATVAIDLASRAIASTWKNGCEGSRGIALDAQAGLLFVGCAEGGATALDLRHDGHVAGRVKAGRGVDVIAYSPSLHHLYLPSAGAAEVTVASVMSNGGLAALGTIAGADGGHCGTTDDHGRVFVCAPSAGALVVDDDPYPATRW